MINPLYLNWDISKTLSFEIKSIKLDRYIINKDATILFWSDSTKTISKRDKDDVFDKELGFLYAYFYKKCAYSKTARKRILNCINEKKIKDFLLEFYVKEEKITKEKAKKNLNNLKVDIEKLKK